MAIQQWQTIRIGQLSDAQRKLGLNPAALLPAGGGAGQVLAKVTAANWDVGWTTILGGLITAGNGIVFAGTAVHFAQSAAYTAGRTPYCATGATIGFDARYWFWDAANGYLGYGTEAPANPLEVVRVSAETAAREFFNFDLEVTANADPNAARRCLSVRASTTGAATFNQGLVGSFMVSCFADGSGNSPSVGYRYIAAEVYHGKGSLGIGNVGVTAGIYIRAVNGNATGVVDQCADLVIDTPLATGTITSNWAIKQNSTDAFVELRGKCGLGNVAPSATSWATLGASTATITSLRITAGSAAYAGTVEGDFWNDYTQKCLIGHIDGLKQFDLRTMFVATADKTVTNTNAETTLFGTGIGTLTFPANFFVVGKSVRITLRGIETTDGAPPTITYRVKIGGTTYASCAHVPYINATDIYWELSFVVTCRTTGAGGTAIGQGNIMQGGDAATPIFARLYMNTTAALNTTGTLALDVTAHPNSASAASSLTVTNALVEIIA